MNNSIHDLKQFVTAGRAIFTVKNTETDNRFTFKVNRKVNDDNSVIYFVSVLTGPCNDSNYTYMGMVTPSGAFTTTRNSRITDTALSFKAFAWIWNHITVEMPNKLEFRHEGHCGRCGRKLTTPESIDAGFGPSCLARM